MAKRTKEGSQTRIDVMKRPRSAIAVTLPGIVAACLIAGQTGPVLAGPVAEKVTKSAVESSLETLAQQENQRRLGTILGSPDVQKGARSLTSAITAGVIDGVLGTNLTRKLTDGSNELGPKLGRSMREHIAPGVAAITGQAVDAALTSALARKHVNETEHMVGSVTHAAMRGVGEGLAQDVGPALAHTIQNDLGPAIGHVIAHDIAPAVAQAMHTPEMREAVSALTYDIAHQLVLGSAEGVETSRADQAQQGEEGLLDRLGGQVALGYAIAVFVAFAFGSLLVVLGVMIVRTQRHTRKLEEEGRRREQAMMAMIREIGGRGGQPPGASALDDYMQERLHTET